ncbi:hypothetical protein F2981_22775 (plasmid) [Sinorhizobium meliloti]|nr:hypothetical protein [Sinorhizobium meliloti]
MIRTGCRAQAVVQVGHSGRIVARRPPLFNNIEDFASSVSIENRAAARRQVGYLSPELAPIANPNLMALTNVRRQSDIEKLKACAGSGRSSPSTAISSLTPAPACHRWT